ncbi:non-canonical purine NTP pyrophosphatase, rdgB/HAM1 family [Idiomarina sp. A28L]|uniref:RdgB/HAM1 family non-canonical purine NTP pyrophosphatase n=1 Tax=Idiomarina sp. A28L TaxID=1036674 RepID=UPI0002138976|nr:RdgB/HAM1 family non-canonical purine NTP pyrophosphatase [Idiomarina sp. A28L]EGN76225.1 non-canonical purine NTP pyrophosphatase, rdgB/HAM1 family [Idiomarina sp. A28L]
MQGKQSLELVLATGNKGKVAELSELLAPLGWQVTPQTELNVSDADETGLTFIENAIIKARHACESTGLPALADDSGLAVRALGGAPGIYSARYAGENATDNDNVEKLLAAMQGVPAEQRQAEFHCVLVFMQSASDPTPIVCHGRWEGMLTEKPAGAGGFGYDPIFWVPERNCTSAELSKSEKQVLSHRAKALKLLVKQLT